MPRLQPSSAARHRPAGSRANKECSSLLISPTPPLLCLRTHREGVINACPSQRLHAALSKSICHFHLSSHQKILMNKVKKSEAPRGTTLLHYYASFSPISNSFGLIFGVIQQSQGSLFASLPQPHPHLRPSKESFPSPLSLSRNNYIFNLI